MLSLNVAHGEEENICINAAGFKCLQKFTYKGVLYHNCTTAGAGNYDPWCYDIRGNEYWDYCKGCEGMTIKSFLVIFKIEAKLY